MRTPEEILRESKTIAVVGLAPDPQRPAYEVAEYLQQQGYRIIPVHPDARPVLGEAAYASLRDIPHPVDVVDVFRRANQVVPIAEEAVAIGARVFWLQLGIVNEEAGEVARRGGLDVVMDHCMRREHRALREAGKL